MQYSIHNTFVCKLSDIPPSRVIHVAPSDGPRAGSKAGEFSGRRQNGRMQRSRSHEGVYAHNASSA